MVWGTRCCAQENRRGASEEGEEEGGGGRPVAASGGGVPADGGAIFVECVSLSSLLSIVNEQCVYVCIATVPSLQKGNRKSVGYYTVRHG